MRDGINMARHNLPAIALLTSDFVDQGDFIAQATGMPDVPRIELPHPIAGSGVDNMRRVADAIADSIQQVLTGGLTGLIPWDSASPQHETTEIR